MRKATHKKSRGPTRKRPAAKVPRKNASPSPLLERLKKNLLFYGVDPRLIARTVPGTTEHRFPARSIIFDEATRGRDLYLIHEGTVRINKLTKYGVDSHLAELHAGDFFGELSALDGLPRSAQALALTDCVLLALHPNDVAALVRSSPQFCMNLLTSLTVRLRTMDQTYVVEMDRSTLAMKNRLDKLHTLIEASKIVNSAIEIDRLLGIILDVAARSIGADRGTLYLLDTTANELWSKVAQGSNMVEIRLPVGKGLAGYVASTGETVNITDAYKDPRFNPEIDRKSGYKTRNVLCMPMRNKDGTILGVFQFLNKRNGAFGDEDEGFIDALSVHASIALENARMAREMVQSERLSAVGRMASTIIHDIKNPMGTMRMYAQVIKSKTGNTEAAALAEEMIRQVDRFVNMTQEILDFSRGVSELQLEDVNAEEIMNDVLDFIEQDMGKRNVTLVRKFEFKGTCTIDVEKMARAFYNLASNAADAMSEGGTLTVTTRRRDHHMQIAFIDTGTGIPENIRHRIFEPFFSSGKRHGTGLGLPIVKKIVEDHRGTLEVESEPGKGTTFRILLPLAEQ